MNTKDKIERIRIAIEEKKVVLEHLQAVRKTALSDIRTMLAYIKQQRINRTH